MHHYLDLGPIGHHWLTQNLQSLEQNYPPSWTPCIHCSKHLLKFSILSQFLLTKSTTLVFLTLPTSSREFLSWWMDLTDFFQSTLHFDLLFLIRNWAKLNLETDIHIETFQLFMWTNSLHYVLYKGSKIRINFCVHSEYLFIFISLLWYLFKR